MKTFSDLTATQPSIKIVVSLARTGSAKITLNGHDLAILDGSITVLHPLLEPIDLVIDRDLAVEQITIDGFDLFPQWHWCLRDSRLHIPEPFYRWRHRITGQGWLLEP
jgi:hypothetical protein